MDEADVLDKLVCASLSDAGRSRSENQDAWREARNALDERLLVVADGMGGHRGGAEASQICVRAIEQRFLEQHESAELRLRRGIDEANAQIHRCGLEGPDLAGMGATCVALVLCSDGQGWVAWLGDSRLYRLRDGVLEQLTEDHSLVAEWQKLGVLSPEQAASHPKRNELTRAVGVMREVEPEVRPLEIRLGDRYLLCSDGLSGVVDEPTLKRLLACADPDDAARRLVEAANQRGGPDNVTVQIAWLPPDPADAPERPEPPPAEPVTEAALPEFELPERPPAPPPLVPRAAQRRAPSPFGSLPPAPARTTLPDEPRRVPRLPRSRGLHPPSAVLGVLGGLLLGLASLRYMAWQSHGSAAPPAARLPSHAPVSPPAAQTPSPAGEAPAVPEPATRPEQASPAPPRPEPRPTRARPSAPSAPPQAAETAHAGSQAPAVEWLPVPEPIPTSAHFDLPGPVHAFLDAWLAALARDDAAAYRALGFPGSEVEFLRTESARESFRLLEASVSPRTTPSQIFVRLRLSYAFENGSGRYRTDAPLRFILEPAPGGGLRFAGQWSE